MHKYFFPLRGIGFSYASEIGVRYGKRKTAVGEKPGRMRERRSWRSGTEGVRKDVRTSPARRKRKARPEKERGGYATGLGTFAESQSRSMILLHWGVR